MRDSDVQPAPTPGRNPSTPREAPASGHGRRAVLRALGLAGLGVAAGASAAPRLLGPAARFLPLAGVPAVETLPLPPASAAVASPTSAAAKAAAPLAKASTGTSTRAAAKAATRAPTSGTSRPSSSSRPSGTSRSVSPAAPTTTTSVPPPVPAAAEAARAAADRHADQRTRAALQGAERGAAADVEAARRMLSSKETATSVVAGPAVAWDHGWAGMRQALTSDDTYSGYAAVAASTVPTSPGVFSVDPQQHLLRRATFGARPADVAALTTLGIDGWLSRQLQPETIDDSEGDAGFALFPLAGASAAKIRSTQKSFSWDAMGDTCFGNLGRQLFSNRQLFEQVVDVMANHLHVAVPAGLWDTSPAYLGDVVRPYAFGRYRDMLQTAMRHPAMLQFLNNDVSSKTLVNENLGRELLELHTVGISAGYTETDVVQSAKVLTGRTTSNGAFSYRSDLHWTGPLQVMGWSHPNSSAADGLAVGDSYLAYLAGHPSTARAIATKLATRFVADQPPSSLIDRLATAYLANDTDLRAVVDALFRSPEFWASTGQRSRRPLEDLIGAFRVIDIRPGNDTAQVVETLYWMLRRNGQPSLGWDPPNGFPDVATAWNNAGSLVERFSMHRALVNAWWSGLTYPGPTGLVDMPAGMTAGQWVDALSLRVLGQTMAPAHRGAVLAFAGVNANDPASKASRQGWGLVPLLFDSPYFQLR